MKVKHIRFMRPIIFSQSKQNIGYPDVLKYEDGIGVTMRNAGGEIVFVPFHNIAEVMLEEEPSGDLTPVQRENIEVKVRKALEK